MAFLVKYNKHVLIQCSAMDIWFQLQSLLPCDFNEELFLAIKKVLFMSLLLPRLVCF